MIDLAAGLLPKLPVHDVVLLPRDDVAILDAVTADVERGDRHRGKEPERSGRRSRSEGVVIGRF